MPSHYTDVEKLLLQRWPDVRALLTAYGELQDSMEQMLTDTGEQLQTWADEQGYAFETDARDAEYTTWKESWANRRNEPGVWFVIGGFVPDGYRKVKYEHPYIWVVTDPDALRIKSSLRQQFARDLRGAAGDQLTSWQNDETDDGQPLGRYLVEYDDSHRLHWMVSPASLIEFVKGAFGQLIPLAEPIDRVMKSYK